MTPAAMKQHDTAPPLTMYLTDGPAAFDQAGALTNGVDVSAATAIRLLLKRPAADVVARTIADRPADGVLTYQWVAEDTADEGPIRVEVEVTWPDGTVQTWPASGAATVQVYADLG